MITERLTFRAKYGHGDELVALFKEWHNTMARDLGAAGHRIYTDATGPMFTVAVETDFADMAAYGAYTAKAGQVYGEPRFADWFGRMQQVTEHGERQIFNLETLAQRRRASGPVIGRNPSGRPRARSAV